MSRNLDFLRAVAALVVVLAHLVRDVFGIRQIAGFLVRDAARAGVFLFFVHTALVLLLSFDRRPWTIPSFYIRRAFRIYPLSIVCVLLVFALRIPFAPLHPFVPISMPRLAANLTLVQNLSPDWKEVIAPLWSLPWEVQMYLVLPFLYLAIRRGAGTLPLLALWLLTGVVGGITWGHGPERALRIFQYVPCFLAGAIAYVQFGRRGRRAHSSLWPVIVVGSVLIYPIVQWLMHPAAMFASKYVLCLAIGYAIPRVAELPESLLTRTSHAVAKYSYGIYLSHFPLMWLVFRKLDLPPLAQWPLFLALSIAVPVLAYHAIERPLIEMGRRLAAPPP